MQTKPWDPREQQVTGEADRVETATGGSGAAHIPQSGATARLPVDLPTPRKVMEFPRRFKGLPAPSGPSSLEHACSGCWIALAMHWNDHGDWVGCYGAIEKSAAKMQQTTVPDLEARILDHCVLAAGGKLAQHLYEDPDDVDNRVDALTLSVKELRLVRAMVKGTLAIAKQCWRHGVPPVTERTLRQALDSAEGECYERP